LTLVNAETTFLHRYLHQQYGLILPSHVEISVTLVCPHLSPTTYCVYYGGNQSLDHQVRIIHFSMILLTFGQVYHGSSMIIISPVPPQVCFLIFPVSFTIFLTFLSPPCFFLQINTQNLILIIFVGL
jgi:hypothetical protein